MEIKRKCEIMKLKLLNLIKIDSKREFGYSLELLYNYMRIALFIAIDPFTLTTLLGIWKFNLLIQLTKGG